MVWETGIYLLEGAGEGQELEGNWVPSKICEA